jgi:hypothetical protein
MAFHVDSRSVEGEEYAEHLFIPLQREKISGYWPKADMSPLSPDVRFGGIVDIAQTSENVR